MRKNAWIVAAVVALAVTLSLVRSTLQPEIWASQALVRVLNASSTSLLPEQSRVDPVREVEIQRLYANSASIQQEVTNRLGVAAKRIDSVEITGLPTADAVQFRITSENRQVAQNAAQAYADVYVDSRRTEIADLTRVQTEKLDGDAAGIKEEISGIDRRLGEIAPQVIIDVRGVPLLPPESEESKGLRANREALSSRLTETEKQAEQLEVDASVRQGAITVVAPAERPKEPVQPRPFRDGVVATALGLFVGLALALARSRFDDRIREASEIEDTVASGVAAVSIPHNPSYATQSSDVILPFEDRRSQEREAYRALRTTLLFGQHDERPARRVLVTSPNQGDGKTTTSANLALSMANSGRRVVLIDCDLRRPRVHAVMGVSNDVGLVSVARDGAPLQDALRTVDLPDSRHLDVLTAGPVSDNPAELLMSGAVTAIIDRLAERYDCVLIDSSPLRAVADALPLANLVDGVILIARADVTRRRDLVDAMAQLEQVSSHLLAVVVSQVRNTKDGRYSAYYGYYGAGPTDSGPAGSTDGDKSAGPRIHMPARGTVDRSTTKT
ncbi:MAG: polysaccharide biosynthesis tyrosine autokinase [Acidimicrobiia bacterium]|nr:polysaccharide biosynthesis tyrosine autokinase [Acidimicrobiia bacterium]